MLLQAVNSYYFASTAARVKVLANVAIINISLDKSVAPGAISH